MLTTDKFYRILSEVDENVTKGTTFQPNILIINIVLTI